MYQKFSENKQYINYIKYICYVKIFDFFIKNYILNIVRECNQRTIEIILLSGSFIFYNKDIAQKDQLCYNFYEINKQKK